jgi:hypothetical protein
VELNYVKDEQQRDKWSGGAPAKRKRFWGCSNLGNLAIQDDNLEPLLFSNSFLGTLCYLKKVWRVMQCYICIRDPRKTRNGGSPSFRTYVNGPLTLNLSKYKCILFYLSKSISAPIQLSRATFPQIGSPIWVAITRSAPLAPLV